MKPMKMRRLTAAALAATTMAGLAVGVAPAAANGGPDRAARVFEVTVEITNLAPEGGTIQTPVWVASHDGSFDLYDRDAPASPALERIAEDGNAGPLVDAFADSGAGTDAVAFADNGEGVPPVIFPGNSTSVSFLVDTTRGEAQYFSYASMVIPSNDAFVANGNPMAHMIFNERGRFMPASFIVGGDAVLDAGTEVNDEVPENTAALAQSVPDTGVAEGGVVTMHEGFMPGGNVLTAIPNGDFTAEGYEALHFEVSAKRINSRAAAALRGNLEVPAVQTQASGLARLVLEEDGDIDWVLNARRIDGVFAAHIHMGAAGENGGVIVALPLGDDANVNNRLSATGELTDADLPDGMTTLDLWQMIQNGETYINVHTVDHPSGELRANLP